MTTVNSTCFLFLSALMISMPSLAPAWFPPTGFDGTNGRATWLVLMGGVQASLASTFLFTQWVLPAARRIAAYRPQLRTRDAMVPQGAAQGQAV